MGEELTRAVEMLRVAMNYIRDNCDDAVIFYDDAECDGACVAGDCEIAADMLEARMGAINSDALEMIEAKASIAELEGFIDEFAEHDFAPEPMGRNHHDEDPDPVTDAGMVWAFQEDARELLKGGK